MADGEEAARGRRHRRARKMPERSRIYGEARYRETRARFPDFASKATASGEGERKQRRESLLYGAWRDDTETKEEDNKNAHGDLGAPVSFARADLSSALESCCFLKRR